MGGVEDDRRAGLAPEDRQRAHIGDERIVAETCPPFGHQDVSQTGGVELGDDVLHIPRRKKLTLLDVDGPAGLGRGDQKIGLTAEESRDLQRVDRLRNRLALAALVHVGDDGQAQRLADFGKDRQRGFEPHPALARPRGPVGLIEGGLEHEADRAAARNLLERLSHLERMARLSSWHGPAMSANGSAGPKRAASGPRPI